MLEGDKTLLQRAQERFQPGFSPAEQQLLMLVPEGKEVDCRRLHGPDKSINADLLVWLCTDSGAVAQVTTRGIYITGATIENKFSLEWATVTFPLRFHECAFTRAIDLQSSRLFFLQFSATSIQELRAKDVTVDRSVLLHDGFSAQKTVDLSGSDIRGDLACDGGQFRNLLANMLHIGGSVGMGKDQDKQRMFTAAAGVDFTGATIDGIVNCQGGQFKRANLSPTALSFNSAKIKGSVFLSDGFTADGAVDLRGSIVGENLDCSGGTFKSGGGHARQETYGFALNAASCDVKGSVYFRKKNYQKVEIHGGVSFAFAMVARDFQWRDVSSPKMATLDLKYAKIRTLHNERRSWPKELILVGLVYEHIGSSKDSVSAKEQFRWLDLQSNQIFSTQPYEQLATLFRATGLQEDERKVLVRKNRAYAKRKKDWKEKFWEFWWFGLFGRLIGYGYRLWRVFIPIMIIIGFSSYLFGSHEDLFSPTAAAVKVNATQQSQAPASSGLKFNPIAYSVETFVPFLKLGVSQYWAPNSGSWVQNYLWLHIAAGWILTTLWVGGVTGLLKS
jgi:hypothetical protein